MKTKPEEAWALFMAEGSVLVLGAVAFVAMVALAGYMEWAALAVPSKPKIDDLPPAPVADVEPVAVAPEPDPSAAPSVEKPSDVDAIRQNVSLLALEIVKRDDQIRELKRQLAECRR